MKDDKFIRGLLFISELAQEAHEMAKQLGDEQFVKATNVLGFDIAKCIAACIKDRSLEENIQ